jgi:hypothetical protein
MAEAIVRFIAWVLGLVPVAALAVGAFYLFKFLRSAAISKLIYSREFSEGSAFAGDSVYMTETVYNKTLMPLFFVDIEGYLYRGLTIDDMPADKKEMQHFVSRMHLLPFMQIKRVHKITCEKRGVYTVDTVSVFTGGNNVVFNAPATITVYPEIRASAPLIPAVTAMVGDHITSRALMVVIDWKLTNAFRQRERQSTKIVLFTEYRIQNRSRTLATRITTPQYRV